MIHDHAQGEREGGDLLAHRLGLEARKDEGAQLPSHRHNRRGDAHIVGPQLFELRLVADELRVYLQQQRLRFFVLLVVEFPGFGLQKLSGRIDESKIHPIAILAGAPIGPGVGCQL